MAHDQQDQQATAARHSPVPVPLPLPLLPPPLPPPPHQGHHNAFEQGVMQHARPGTSSGRVLVVQRQSLAQHVDQQDASPPHAHLEQPAGGGPAIPPQPSAPSSTQQPHNYKTQLCRRWQAGFCALGGRCTFAHGNEELRSMPDRPTVTCRYWQSGHCKAGDRCHFLHGTPEAQQQQQQEAQHSQQQRQPHPQSQPWQDASQGAQQGNGQAAAWPELASERVPAQQRPAPAHDLVARDPAVLVATLQGTHLSGPGSSGATPAAHPQQEALPGTSSGAGSGKQGSAAPSATTSPAPPAPQLSEEMAGVLQRRFGSLLCPITLEPFVDPVVAADGNIYERHAIEGWLYRDGNNASPLTNEPLAHKMLMPCGTMRRCIAEVAEFVAAMQRQVL